MTQLAQFCLQALELGKCHLSFAELARNDSDLSHLGVFYIFA
jgi:hypothetical protein